VAISNQTLYDPSTSPNGTAAYTHYDSYGRVDYTLAPSQFSSAGPKTTYAYTYTSGQWTVTGTGPSHWAKTTQDGLGRTVSTQTGYGGTVVSQVDTVYGPCACSPTGKMMQESQPYAPGDTPVYTTYAYDALGRTVGITKPDGASATHYTYSGNVVQVTDAVGNWKQYFSDALGHLTTVREPNPAARNDRSQDLWTYYTYDALDHLVQVQMPRDGTTQYRTFNYTDAGGHVGPNLLSATNPENGTVTYTYNSDNTVATRVDAKGQKMAYNYDSYGRLTQIQHYPDGTHEDTTQQVNLYYDSYTGAGANTLGRLAAASNGQVKELYGYTVAGLLTSKQMRTLWTSGLPGSTWAPLSYTYDSEGRIASVSYPATTVYNGMIPEQVPGPVYNYSYDSLGRPTGLVQQDTGATVVNNVQYGPAGQLLQMQESGILDTFQYNSLLQLTRTTAKYTANNALLMDMQYTYSATQNNGEITQSQDFVTGEQVTFQYDCLQRLTSAATSGPQWGLTFSYDGFGNRLSQQATKGTPPSVYSTYDASSNRITGYPHDANGNITSLPNGTTLTYDVENRVVSANTGESVETYLYAPDGKRVGWQTTRGWTYIYFYGVMGERLGPYMVDSYGRLQWSGGAPGGGPAYFAGKRLGMATDRLGSARGNALAYYPYGEMEQTAYEDEVRFATYVRDSATGLDYAQHRYYSSIIGRFLSPDPSLSSNALVIPENWNKYAYVGGDPINKTDPFGLCSPNDDPPCYSVTLTEFLTGAGGGAGGGDNGYIYIPTPWDKLDMQKSQYLHFLGQRTSDQSSARVILSADRAAADRLFDPDCAGLFLAPDDNTAKNRAALSGQLDKIGDDGLIRPMNPRNLPAGTSPNTPAFTAGRLIYVVSGGAFFTGQINGHPLGGFASGMTLTGFQQLVIIHEFLHWDNIVGSDNAGQKYTLPNGDTVRGSNGISQEVKNKCFN
jgi:RHS repeat-associated protein